jgi:outer membrane protein TolC
MQCANKWLEFKNVLPVILAVTCLAANGQQKKLLTLQQTFKIAEEQYPLTRQKDLLKQTEDLSLQNLNTGFLPQVSLNGQATYQSDVTKISIPFPGLKIPEQPKDQYKVLAEVNQLLYDGGIIRGQQSIQRLNTSLEENKIAVELYQLKTRLHQIYFGILYQDELLKQASLTAKDVQIGIDKIIPLVENKVVLRSNLQLLQAQLLQVQQKKIEIISSRIGLINALSLFLNEPLAATTEFEMPGFISPSDSTINRPEILLFESQSDILAGQESLIRAKNLPKANAFVQGGIGRPALNMLSNELKSFYITGLRVTWPLGGLYTKSRDKKLIDISRKGIDLQKETFLLNTRSQLQQQKADIAKFQELINSDIEIIQLRHAITDAAKAQLENAVITANDYLLQVNAEDTARQAMLMHQLQLLQAETNYAITAGKL